MKHVKITNGQKEITICAADIEKMKAKGWNVIEAPIDLDSQDEAYKRPITEDK